MTFYINTVDGTPRCAGRRFATLAAAIKAAQTSIRITARLNTHGYTGLYVWEDIPGRHVERATVYPDHIIQPGA